jgi:hypothetical protein
MASELDGIVQVTITKETTTVAQANFGIYLVVDEVDGGSPKFTGRTKTYSSLSEMADDSWASGDYAYDAAAKFFSQNPNPGSIKVGQKYITTGADASWTAALVAIRTEDPDFYGFSISSTTLADQKLAADWAETEKVIYFCRSSDSDIVELAAPSSGYATVSNSGSVGSFPGATVPAIPTQVDYELDVTVDGTLYQLDDISISITDDWDTVAAAIQTSLQTATSSTETCIIDIAEKIRITSVTTGESSTIIIAAGTAGTGSGDLLAAIDALGATYTTVLDTPVDGEEDIAYYAQNLNLERTAVYYHTDTTDQDYIDAAAPAEAFPYPAGSQTWSYKTLSGVATYNLTTAQFNTATGKNANVYTSKASVSITQNGTVGSGEYLDIIRGIDWLESRLQENIFALQVNSRKIPYTDAGIRLQVNVVKEVLQEAADNGLLLATSIVVTAPELSETSSTDRANRVLDSIDFTAQLQGAVHKTVIVGKVTV